MKVEHIQLETVWRLFWEFENLEFSQNIMPFTQFIVDWNQRLFDLKDLFPQKYNYTGIEFNELELGQVQKFILNLHWITFFRCFIILWSSLDISVNAQLM